jgi:hypothetical protein
MVAEIVNRRMIVSWRFRKEATQPSRARPPLDRAWRAGIKGFPLGVNLD